MVRLREQRQSTEARSCKHSSTPNEKTENKEIRVEIDDKSIIDIIVTILKAREGGSKSGIKKIWTKKWSQ